jgi:hypothetical protein
MDAARAAAAGAQSSQEVPMKLRILDRVWGLLRPRATAPSTTVRPSPTAMKAEAFEHGCDDLGQYEGDVDQQVPALKGPAMKAREFERGCDDLGQYEGDVERQVPALKGPAMKAQAFQCGCDDLGQYEGDVERQAAAAVGAAKYVH